MAQKLLERFFRVYLELERLQPETITQGVLFKHVKQVSLASSSMSSGSVWPLRACQAGQSGLFKHVKQVSLASSSMSSG